jgi:hypothetical protein
VPAGVLGAPDNLDEGMEGGGRAGTLGARRRDISFLLLVTENVPGYQGVL